jgi:hypothetical protein
MGRLLNREWVDACYDAPAVQTLVGAASAATVPAIRSVARRG